MKIVSAFLLFMLSASIAVANQQSDEFLITEAVTNYIVAQHKAKEAPMDDALHQNLKKQTYWQDRDGEEFIMETSRRTMLDVAKSYNQSGTKFPETPRVDIDIYDIDQRVASVKLTADDWIDYMHLVKTDSGDWKILNVLWQYHDTKKHSNK